MTFLQELFSFLNAKAHYAVLRNWDGLPDHCKGRDIDIVIPRKEFRFIRKEILRLAPKYDLKVVLCFESERFNTLFLGNARTHVLLQMDFFFHCSVRGTIVLDSETLLKNRVFENGIYHAHLSQVFLDKFLFNTLLAQPYPQKYNDIRILAEKEEQVAAVLQEKFGTSKIEDVEKMPASKLRHKAFWHSIKKRPFRQMANTIHFFFTNFHNWLFPQGISIGFTGPDGVGKTTVMEMVIEELGKVFPGIQLYHFRPGVFPNLGDALHEAGLKKEVDHDYSKPHRGKKTNVFSSLGRLGYYGADYILGYWSKVHKQLYRRNIVVFDRYYTDIITDSKRSRIFLPTGFLLWVRHFIPSMKYNFLIRADEELIAARKQELDRAAIHEILCRMKLLEGKKKFYVVDNSDTPQQAAERILETIYTQQDKKYTG